MARAKSAPAKSRPELFTWTRAWTVWRPYALPVLATTFGALAVMVMLDRFDQFLRSDSRFLLAKPEYGQMTSAGLSVTGVRRASLHSIQRVFEEDTGRSAYLVPVEERRDSLRKLTWVREAMVRRIWPNRVDVAILERVPVAVAQFPARRRNDAPRLLMVDNDGVLLPHVAQSGGDLPVLSGLDTGEDPAVRGGQVRMMRRFFAETVEYGDRVSELDVSDEHNLKVLYPLEDRAVTLYLGDHDWLHRIQRFLRNFPQIRQQMPGVNRLDLRLNDRTLGAEEPDGQ